MKKLILFFAIGTMSLVSFSQNPDLPAEPCLIVLKSNKLVKNARLWNIGTTKIEYQQDGSLHDLATADIKIIKTDDEIISFDGYGKLQIRPYDLIIGGGWFAAWKAGCLFQFFTRKAVWFQN